MNKDQIKGKGENLKGRVKEAAGAITGNKEKEAEGTLERMEGAAREKIAEAKEKLARKTADSNVEDSDDEGVESTDDELAPKP